MAQQKQPERRRVARTALRLNATMRDGSRSVGAISAYRNYLALRSDPEPELKPEVQRVRAELAALVAEPH